MKCTKDERECVTAGQAFRRTFAPRLRNEEMNMEKLIHFLEGMKMTIVGGVALLG